MKKAILALLAGVLVTVGLSAPVALAEAPAAAPVAAIQAAPAAAPVVAVPQLASDVCPSCSGGRVYLSTLSDIRIAVSSTYTDPPPSSTIQYLYHGEWSHLATPIKDVDQFWVGPYCYAKNIDTGYKYHGGSQGLWHNMSSDSVRIRLNHQCTSPWT